MNIKYDNALVSIITPVYNGARFIGETIKSIQAQSYQTWELLVTDDCSTDNTRDLISEHASKDPRIKLLVNAKNSGPAVARRTSYQAAKGRYIAFCDGDDLWTPLKLEKQLSYMRMNNWAYTFTQYRRISQNGEETGHLLAAPTKMNYWQLLRNTAIATSTVLVDRTITGELEFVETYYDDLVFKLNLLKRGFLAYGIQEDLMRYRVVKKSVSRNKLKSAWHVWRTFRDVEKLGHFGSIFAFSGYAINGILKYSKF